MSQTFPAFLFHANHGARLFDNAEDFADALDAGWVDSPAKLTEDVLEQEHSVELLQERATELGIQFDGRWGAKKLQAAIDAHLAVSAAEGQ